METHTHGLPLQSIVAKQARAAAILSAVDTHAPKTSIAQTRAAMQRNAIPPLISRFAKMVSLDSQASAAV